MNKELKFRAWLKKYKKMVDVKRIDFTGRKSIMFDLLKLENNYVLNTALLKDVELMEYIGKKDINTKEIYEGDILLRYENKKIYLVVYNEILSRFLLVNKDEKLSPYMLDCPDERFEIIGTKWNNPKLLLKSDVILNFSKEEILETIKDNGYYENPIKKENRK